jgi:hypothetical protein
VLINPFSKNDSNEIIQYYNNGTADNVVQGLIFETDQIITAQRTYQYPQIISEASTKDVQEFEGYSYNINPGYTTTYTHNFIENCWVLNPIVPTYFVFASIWLVITIAYTVYLYMMPAIERFSMQKSMIMLPALKTLEVFLDGCFLSMCPWYGQPNETSIQYVQMARISVITICYTAFLAFFYILSKGWGTTAVQLSRNQATNLTMIMGGVYLAYSAYFLSIDFSVVYTVMNIIMVLLYSGLGWSYFRSCRANIGKIDENLSFLRNNNENIMQDSLIIKR